MPGEKYHILVDIKAGIWERTLSHKAPNGRDRLHKKEANPGYNEGWASGNKRKVPNGGDHSILSFSALLQQPEPNLSAIGSKWNGFGRRK